MTLPEAKELFNNNAASVIDTNAMALINEAIDSRIDAQPYYRREEDDKGWACPRCDMGVTVDHGRIREQYCSSCGQKLDWTNIPSTIIKER